MNAPVIRIEAALKTHDRKGAALKAIQGAMVTIERDGRMLSLFLDPDQLRLFGEMCIATARERKGIALPETEIEEGA